MGRNLLLYDFTIGVIPGVSAQKPTIVESTGNPILSSGYSYLYADTLFELRKVLSKLEQSTHLDCYLLCLRILSRIINEFKTSDYA